MAAVVLLSTTASQSQINNSKTENVKVFGNCNMCESTIEKAANKKNTSKADWNEETKVASITYDSEKTNLDAVLKNIALAGYDNQSFLAPDDAYNKLPDCCKYDRVAKASVKTDNVAENHSNHPDMSKTEDQKSNQLKAVFDSYFLLKDALVKTDRTLTSAKAKELQTSINAVEMGKLAMDVHTVWMKVLDDLKEGAENINSSKDISKQRDQFMSLSKNMYELIKVADPSETVYYQFCPMANEGKGANWLSKESDIKNPYYGIQMLSCGKTLETIR